MFRLRDLKNGLFQIHSKAHNKAFEGMCKAVCHISLQMGIPEDELILALEELTSTGNDYADFGFKGKFIRTMKNP
jgi:hypothetical protein